MYNKDDNLDEDDDITKKAPKPKTKTYIFIGLTLIASIVVFALAVVLAVTLLGGRSGNETTDVSPTEAPVTDVTETSNASTTDRMDNHTLAKAIVKEVDVAGEKVLVYAYNAGKAYMLNIASDSATKDIENKDIKFTDLKAGDIIDTEFYTTSKDVITLKISTEGWEKKDVSGISVDKANHRVTVGGVVYAFDNQVIAFQKGKPVSIENLTTKDLVNIKGVKNTLLFVEVTKGHGLVEIINAEKIKEGTIEIGTEVKDDKDAVKFTASVKELLLSIKEPLGVVEGKYVVKIKGANIDEFKTEIEVVEGNVVTLDLKEIQIKSGALNVKVNVPDAYVYIDGKQVSTEDPIIIEYGKYTLKVSKDKYDTSENKIVIKEPITTVTVTLKETIVLGKVNITTIPPNADVYIDDVLIGKSPVETRQTLGEHNVVIKLDGYEDFNSPIFVTEDSTKTFNFTLNKLPEPEPTEVPEPATTTPAEQAPVTTEPAPITTEPTLTDVSFTPVPQN